MATEAVRDITPEVISRTAEVPWVNHFVALEAHSYGYQTERLGYQGIQEVTRDEWQHVAER